MRLSIRVGYREIGLGAANQGALRAGRLGTSQSPHSPLPLAANGAAHQVIFFFPSHCIYAAQLGTFHYSFFAPAVALGFCFLFASPPQQPTLYFSLLYRRFGSFLRFARAICVCLLASGLPSILRVCFADRLSFDNSLCVGSRTWKARFPKSVCFCSSLLPYKHLRRRERAHSPRARTALTQSYCATRWDNATQHHPADKAPAKHVIFVPLTQRSLPQRASATRPR